MSSQESASVYAVIEWQEGRPLILAFQRDATCPTLRQELVDPELDKLRLVVRHPDRVADILRGEVIATPAEKLVIELRPSADPEWFLDAEGRSHRVLPCSACTSTG